MNYWWINANPHDDKNPWSWTKSLGSGQMEEWNSKNEQGGTRKYFSKVKVGDLVIGYNSGKQRELVALGKITGEMHLNKDGIQVIDVIKTKDIQFPISIEEVRQNDILKDKFSNGIKVRGTIISLTREQYDELIKMIV
ncbi:MULTISPECIES: EVE domain-containing protein [Clostridium]|uniref:EVE domain-containing protein n=1 Tax=Clostridium frigoriphilum TaxID=443253 RepID=A0ABU7UTU3_9CLOT|nr:EVE domain-containing protein [Clostridium sp. DSM 17811]MBU3101585.1 EVE domain-containing protein [Clostridium sp. DSM 17811]